MVKTAAERIREMAKTLSQRADEIRKRTQGVETNVNTTTYKEFSKQGKK